MFLSISPTSDSFLLIMTHIILGTTLKAFGQFWQQTLFQEVVHTKEQIRLVNTNVLPIAILSYFCTTSNC